LHHSHSVLDPRSDSARRKIRDVARITHRNDEAYAGAVAVVAAIRAVLEPSTPKGINDFDAVEIWASAHSEDAAALVPYRVGDLIVKNWSPVGAGWGRYVTVGKPEVNTQHDFLIWDLEKKTSVNIVLPPDRYFEACAGLTRSAFWLVPGLVSSMQRGLMRFSL
jgi:hypothetical protein